MGGHSRTRMTRQEDEHKYERERIGVAGENSHGGFATNAAGSLRIGPISGLFAGWRRRPAEPRRLDAAGRGVIFTIVVESVPQI